MKYLIAQDWQNTHGNHAGMVHMCKLLCEKYPDIYKMYVKTCPSQTPVRKNIILRKLLGWYDRLQSQKQYTAEYLELCHSMFENFQNGDEVFLLEYHWPSNTQHGLAKFIRANYPNIKINALSHLTPTWYRNHRGSVKMILNWEKSIDRQLTLGTTLSDYLVSIGVPKSKIFTGFHYVDRNYYDIKEIVVHEKPTVIVMGALQRDFSLLAEIVKSCTSVNWIICKGNKDLNHMFEGLKNVELKGFLLEDNLRYQMSRADISLNVMEDTVGSNVITTSMAMGLAIIVSNVGSIHDYCSDLNAIFCENNALSFVKAINDLVDNPEKLLLLRKNAYRRSEDFTIENVNFWFNNL